MKLTDQEKTVLITIVIAALAGVLITFLFSYNKRLEQKPREAAQLLINVNTATAADFDKLPGIGKVMAERIIKQREKKNGFKTIEDLRAVKGISAAKFEQIRKYLIITQD